MGFESDGARVNDPFADAYNSPLPMHGAIDAETNNKVARTEATQADRRIATEQVAKSKPIEAEELERQADVQETLGKRTRKQARRQRRKVQRMEQKADALPASRRPRRYELMEMVLATLAAAGCDIPVLIISMTDVPGSMVAHLVLAVLASLGLAIFGGLIGWASARLWENLSEGARHRVGWSALSILLTLFLVTIVALAVFRANELVLLTNSNFHLADPLFFGPLQALLCAAAAIAWFRYCLTETGRQMLWRLNQELATLTALDGLSDQLFAKAEGLRQASAQAVIEGVKALVAYTELPSLEEAEVKSNKSHGEFVHHWFNTVFLRDRFMPKPGADDGLIQFVSGYDQRMHTLRRMLSRAMMLLAISALVAAGYAVHEQAAAVGALALLVALALASLGVYVAYMAEKTRLDTQLISAFVSSQQTEAGGREVPARSNGVGDRYEAKAALAALAEKGQS